MSNIIEGTVLQRRRGTTQELTDVVGVGYEGEILVNEETGKLHVYDGVTIGGHVTALDSDVTQLNITVAGVQARVVGIETNLTDNYRNNLVKITESDLDASLISKINAGGGVDLSAITTELATKLTEVQADGLYVRKGEEITYDMLPQEARDILDSPCKDPAEGDAILLGEIEVVKGRVDALETGSATLTQDIATNATNITSLREDLDDLIDANNGGVVPTEHSALLGLNSDPEHRHITTTEYDEFKLASTNATTAIQDTATLTGRVDTLDGKVTQVETVVNATNTQVDGIETRLTDAETDITTLMANAGNGTAPVDHAQLLNLNSDTHRHITIEEYNKYNGYETTIGQLRTDVDILEAVPPGVTEHGGLTGLNDDELHRHITTDEYNEFKANALTVETLETEVIALEGRLDAVDVTTGALDTKIDQEVATLRGEIQAGGGTGVTDHGSLTGLNDDAEHRHITTVEYDEFKANTAEVATLRGDLEALADLIPASPIDHTTLTNLNGDEEHLHITRVEYDRFMAYEDVLGSVADMIQDLMARVETLEGGPPPEVVVPPVEPPVTNPDPTDPTTEFKELVHFNNLHDGSDIQFEVLESPELSAIADELTITNLMAGKIALYLVGLRDVTPDPLAVPQSEWKQIPFRGIDTFEDTSGYDFWETLLVGDNGDDIEIFKLGRAAFAAAPAHFAVAILN